MTHRDLVEIVARAISSKIDAPLDPSKAGPFSFEWRAIDILEPYLAEDFVCEYPSGCVFIEEWDFAKIGQEFIGLHEEVKPVATRKYGKREFLDFFGYVKDTRGIRAGIAVPKALGRPAIVLLVNCHCRGVLDIIVKDDKIVRMQLLDLVGEIGPHEFL